MIPVADILQEPQFGREGVEMKMIHSYKKALCEIETQHTVRDPRKEEEGVEEGAEGADPSNKQKKRAAWAAKQKARQEKKSRFSRYWFPIKGGGAKILQCAYPFRLHVKAFSCLGQ